MRVVVVGGGIAGLSAARFVSIARPDVEVILLEQSGMVGGKLRSDELAGYRIDVGAEAMLARRPEGVDLLDALGLADERISPLTTAAGLWIAGTRHPIPGGTLVGIPGDVDAVARSEVLSAAGLERLRDDEGREHPVLDHDVSVGELIGARLGPEVVERIVDPLLGGVYAGRADQISLRAAVPALAAELARSPGSLLQAVRAVTRRSAASAAGGPVFASIVGGLGRLPEVIVGRSRFVVRTSAAVQAIARDREGFLLSLGSRADGEHLRADAVVVATPAAKGARLLQDLVAPAAADLAAIRMASAAIVSFAFAAGTVVPAGSGLLVPAVSGRAVKGVTISSQKWPGGPTDLLLLRASLGRIGEEAVLQRDDGELISLARRDLIDLLGIGVPPVDAIVTRWGGGLPQYDVGHVERVERIRAEVAAVPGLAVAGASYDGVGIPACIHSARRAADRVLAHLSGRGQ